MNEDLAVAIIKAFFINIYTYLVFSKITNQKTINLLKIIIASGITAGIYLVFKVFINNIFSILMMYFLQIIFFSNTMSV